MNYQDFIDALPQFLADTGAAALLVALSVTVYFLIVQTLKSLSKRDKLPAVLVDILSRWLRWATVIVALLLMLQSYGLLENAWTSITAVLGLVAIGFVAVWSILSNTLCTIVLLIVRPFEVGDTVEIPGDQVGGKVVNFNMFFTRLQTDQGDHFQVPNNIFFQKTIRRRAGDGAVTLDEQLNKDTDTP